MLLNPAKRCGCRQRLQIRGAFCSQDISLHSNSTEQRHGPPTGMVDRPWNAAVQPGQTRTCHHSSRSCRSNVCIPTMAVGLSKLWKTNRLLPVGLVTGRSSTGVRTVNHQRSDCMCRDRRSALRPPQVQRHSTSGSSVKFHGTSSCCFLGWSCASGQLASRIGQVGSHEPVILLKITALAG
jgi:hypothetical protein